jgi:hypothetical protein
MQENEMVEKKKAGPLDSDDSDVFLNNISVKLGKILKSQTEQIQILKQQTKSQTEQIQVLKQQTKLLSSILTDLEDENDDGEYLFVSGTATTDISANITDLLGILKHKVKGYVITNSGKNTIEIGHNITPGIIDTNIPTAVSRFYPLFAGETHKEMFNRRVIQNIYIRTDIGTSAFRMWLLW